MNDLIYMSRCLELATKGTGKAAPNPVVGAVLVYKGQIIGEGWHKKYGEAHAEVNCINDAVQNGFEKLIPESVLYVSLEPCAHFGKTPPCADLIIRYKIPKVVIGCRDPFEFVNGKGIERLQAAGKDVTVGVLEDDCRELNRRFFTYQEKKRPYIILKWAQTADGKISGGKERLLISNKFTNRLVHRWRSEEAAILVGTNTALSDNPQLNTRLWGGSAPVRVVLDLDLRLPLSLNIFDRKQKTIILNSVKEAEEDNLYYLKIEKENNMLEQICEVLYRQKIQSVLVEGGSRMLQSFIEADLWDEIRVISSSDVISGGGLSSPPLPATAAKTEEIKLSGDKIITYRRKATTNS